MNCILLFGKHGVGKTTLACFLKDNFKNVLHLYCDTVSVAGLKQQITVKNYDLIILDEYDEKNKNHNEIINYLKSISENFYFLKIESFGIYKNNEVIK